CLVVKPQDGRSAALWWGKVERKIAAAAEWDWGRQLTDVILVDEGAMRGSSDLDGDWSLRAGILATAAAINTHGAPARSRSIWSEVLAVLPAYPAGDGRERLRMRGQAGSITARLADMARLTGSPSLTPSALLDQLGVDQMGGLSWSRTHDQGFASILAAFESVVEYIEHRWTRDQRA